MLAVLLSALFFLAVTHAQPSEAQEQRAAARARMVAEIAAMARDTGAETGRPRFGDAVMAAMGKVPRHRFVPALQDIFAYDNRPLPIGEGQTISQPYIVALMTDLLDPKSADTVLEVGTGSGYQAAVLAELVAKVYTIEIVEPLARRARQVLGELGYRNVEVRVGDGYGGGCCTRPRLWQNSGHERLLAEQALLRSPEFRSARRRIPRQPEEDSRPLSPETGSADRGRARRRRVPRAAGQPLPAPVLFRGRRNVRGGFPEKSEDCRSRRGGEVEPWLGWSECSPRVTRRSSSADGKTSNPRISGSSRARSPSSADASRPRGPMS